MGRFDVEVVNPLQALLLGQQGYEQGQKQQQKSQLQTLLGQGASNGGPMDYQGIATSLARSGNLEAAGQVAGLAKAFQPESSSDIQSFKLAQSQGFQGGILDFMKQKAAAGATRVSNNTNVNTGEKEFDKTVGKDYGETFVGTQKAGRDSVGAINNLNLMEKLTADPNFYSGAGGETVTKAKQIAASLGIADANSAAPNELFKKISQKSVLDASGGSLGAGFSNADRSFLEGTVANIGNTPEGNRQIIGIARTVEKRKQEIAQFAREYAKKNGGRIDAGFDSALADWTEKNPAFKNAASRPLQQSAQSVGITQQQYDALPPGTPYTAPDGSPRIKK